MTTVVILPGGFHPYHAGHYALYQSAQRAFPDADVYVAATDDRSTRPFPFAIKEKLAQLAGVEPGHFVQVKSPFQAAEITKNYDPEQDTVIFVRSEKDADQPPRAGGTKKDGSPAYLQPLIGAKKLQPFAKHAYMAYLPVVEFGPGMTSATEIRSAWPSLDQRRKTALVMSLYPKTQTNPRLAATVVKMLDTAIGTGVEESFIGKYPSIATTLGEATRSDLVKYDKRREKQLHRDIDIAQGKIKDLDDLNYDSDEKDWGDLEHAQDYTGGSWETNDYLHRQYRKQAKPEELKRYLAKIQALDRLLVDRKLPQKLVVYTGLRQSPSDAWETYNADISKPIKLHLPAYTSTTTQLNTALEHVVGQIVQVPRTRHKPRNQNAPKDNIWGSQVLMITLPAGTPAASVKKVSEYPEENEILLPRGMDIEISPNPTVLKTGDYVWHAQALGHNPVQIAPPMQEAVDQEDTTENTVGFIQEQDPDYIEEKWSQKYKSSINCANPKGFSQRAHCAGRKK